MPKDDIERSFPRLAGSSYSITIPPSVAYNCAAWAAGETHRWWDPTPEDGYYWPVGVPLSHSVDNLIGAFATLGYQPCSNSEPERGIEKLAIYADATGWPTHVARQLSSGVWASKLGPSEDIEHASLEALEGAIYGNVVQYLSRHSTQ